MPLMEYLPLIVADPVTKEIRSDLFGAEVTIVEAGTDTPVTGLVEARSGAPLTNPVTVSATGYTPWMAIEDGPSRVDAVSGDFRTPIWSPVALESSAADSAASAAVSQVLAEEALELADVHPLIPGANVTFTATAEGTVISATGGGGGEGGITSVTVDSIEDAAPVIKEALKADTSADFKQTMGISEVSVGWAGDAAPASEALRKTGTTAQTIAPKVTFTQAPVLPAESLPLDTVVGAEGRFNAVESRRKVIVLNAQGDDLPDDWRPGDVVLYLTPTTDGGGGTEEPPPVDTTVLRRRFLADIADNTPLTLAGGTGDTTLDAISATVPNVQVVNGVPGVHVIGSGAITWRDSSTLPPLGAFSFDIGLRLLAAPSASAIFLQLKSACSLSLNTSGQVTVLGPDASTAAPSSVGGPAGAASTALAVDAGVYRIKGWRSATTAGTVAQFVIYKPDGTVHWGPVNRDIGVGDATEFIRGKAAPVTGEWIISSERLDDSGSELV